MPSLLSQCACEPLATSSVYEVLIAIPVTWVGDLYVQVGSPVPQETQLHFRFGQLQL